LKILVGCFTADQMYKNLLWGLEDAHRIGPSSFCGAGPAVAG